MVVGNAGRPMMTLMATEDDGGPGSSDQAGEVCDFRMEPKGQKVKRGSGNGRNGRSEVE